MAGSVQDSPVRSEVVDISSGTHTFTIKTITALYNNSGAAGTIVAKLYGDSAARPWKVTAGQYLLGRFVSVSNGGAGTTLTAANDIIGVTGLTSDS